MPHTDLTTRASVVALKSYGGKTTVEVAEMMGLNPRTVDRIYARAIEAGFDPHHRPLTIKAEFVTDKPKAGRPSKQPEAKEKMLSLVRHDRYGREQSCADISASLRSHGINVSASTVFRTLKSAGFRKTKPTRKPGLTPRMR
jgi:transposase